jgi:hypothetical protein
MLSNQTVEGRRIIPPPHIPRKAVELAASQRWMMA